MQRVIDKYRRVCALLILFISQTSILPLRSAVVLQSDPSLNNARPSVTIPASVEAVDPATVSASVKSSTTNTVAEKERPLKLTLELRDGSRLLGLPASTNLSINSGMGSFAIPWQNLASLQFSSQEKGQVSLIFRNGDLLSGALSSDFFEVTTCFGPVRIPTTVVRHLRVVPAGKAVVSGLILYYSFDAQPENDVVIDKSGQGHDGKLIGAQWTPDGKFQGGCIIQGGVDEIQVSNTAQFLLEQFTMAAWIKRSNPQRTSTGGHKGILFGSANGHEFGLEPDGRLFIYNNPEHTIGYKVADLQWHHVAAVKDDQKTTFYLDGVSCGEVPFNLPLDYRQGLAIGSNGSGIGYPFVGTLDEVKIYNRPLSADEIKEIFRAEP